MFLDRVASNPVECSAPRRAISAQVVLPKRTWYWGCKRCLDFVCALLLAMVAAPFVVLAGVLIKLTSRGPIFYSQTRLGLRGKPFFIYKLRSMQHNCERFSGACWATPDDTRITPVGRFLRRSHIDELPQLWNVLRGDMSLVGPRPERPELIPALEREIPGYRQRLEVRPGVTGLAQLQLPPDTDMDSVRSKLVCDLQYVHTLSLRLDIGILLSTPCHLLGIPFAKTSWIFGIAGAREVESADAEPATDSERTSPQPATAIAQ
jgi:lipopolysaccharide/colanic/teichoic acid biosynthesis glycosyltransferase